MQRLIKGCWLQIVSKATITTFLNSLNLSNVTNIWFYQLFHVTLLYSINLLFLLLLNTQPVIIN